MQPEEAAESPGGYLELIRTNRNYRRIWIGDVASHLGDWFNVIALYTLVRELTGSPLALGLVWLTRLLPWALASPVAGLLADRFDRRRLMIAADLLRAVVVLGFILIDTRAEMPLLYLLIALQVIISAVFIPARSASIPNITTARELLTANALSAATWSTLLAVGAALGGFAVAWLGLTWVFVIDSLSYCVSAFFISRARIPQETDAATGKTLRDALRDILDGWQLLRREPRIGRVALTKATWGLGGSGLVYMLALVGEAMSPAARSIGIGLLYAARGVGTGLGPIAARALVPRERHWQVLIGVGFIGSGLAYAALSALPWTYGLVMALVLVAHTPSGANWVLSTVLLQRRTADRYRGRVFASEWLLLTFADAFGILVASLLLEGGWLDLRGGILLFAGVLVVCGVLWLVLIVPRERGDAERSEHRP